LLPTTFLIYVVLSTGPIYADTTLTKLCAIRKTHARLCWHHANKAMYH